METMKEVTKVANGRHFSVVDIDHKSINPALLALGLTELEIDKWVSFLCLDNFLLLYSKDDKKTMLLRIKQKGVAAASSEYFKTKHFDEVRKRKIYSSQIKTDRSTRISNWMSPLFAGAAVILSFFNLIREIQSNKQQQKQVEQLQQKTTQQDSVLKIQRTQIDSLSIKAARWDVEPKFSVDSVNQ